jgi:hypothetical protein
VDVTGQRLAESGARLTGLDIAAGPVAGLSHRLRHGKLTPQFRDRSSRHRSPIALSMWSLQSAAFITPGTLSVRLRRQAPDAAQHRTDEAADGLAPAERLPGSFALLLTDRRTRVARRASVDRRASVGSVLGDVRRNVEVVQCARDSKSIYLATSSADATRKIDKVLAPLFPRYMFVSIDIATQRRRSVQSTYGVSHFVLNGSNPAPSEERFEYPQDMGL